MITRPDESYKKRGVLNETQARVMRQVRATAAVFHRPERHPYEGWDPVRWEMAVELWLDNGISCKVCGQPEGWCVWEDCGRARFTELHLVPEARSFLTAGELASVAERMVWRSWT